MQTESFLRFADCFADALLLLSPQGSILAANRVARERLGIPAVTDALPLQRFLDEPPERLSDLLTLPAAGSGAQVGLLRFRDAADGAPLLCEARALAGPDSPRLLRCLWADGEGDDRMLAASLRQLKGEIAHRQRVERALQASEAHARSVLETAADAIITIDERGLIQSFNPAAERLFGYTRAEVAGRNIKLLMPEPYRTSHDSYIHNYLDTGEKHIIGIGREVQAQRRDGTVFPIELAISEVRLGESLHFTGIIRDISERRQAEERLRQREDEARQHRERLMHVGRLSTLGELATGIAHEINQPLTAIAAYANACQRLLSLGPVATREDLLQTLDKIGQQAQRAGQVIQRLRNLIRRRDSHRELWDLNRLISETLVLAEADARLLGFRIETDLTEGHLPVVVDPVQIQQVLLNLIRNGMDAMLEAGTGVGEIRVQTCQPDTESAEVRVHDQGTGIPEALRENLFNPFFTTKPQGIGLGLSISRSIVISHGGRLGYVPNPDRGATLCFSLPLAVETEDE